MLALTFLIIRVVGDGEYSEKKGRALNAMVGVAIGEV